MHLYFFHTNAEYLLGLRLPMLLALVDAGYQVSAFAPNMREADIEALRAHGIQGRQFRIDSSGVNPFRDLINLKHLVRMLRVEAPDIVFSNNIKPVAFATIAAALAGVRRRYALVGGLGYAFTREPGKRIAPTRSVMKIIASLLYAMAFRLSSKVIFHNRDDLEMLAMRGICPRSKASVVPGSGVDVHAFAPGRMPATPVFIFVGRMLADKGVREFLRAAAVTKSRFPEARILLVGGTDANPSAIETSEIQAFVERNEVEWRGRVSDVRPHLLESSVFVLPSYREGVPRSTLEAMACGLAVITTDAPGCRETVVDGVNGVLVPVGNDMRLAEAMCLLCNDPSLIVSMGAQSRRIAEERFAADLVNRQILDIIREEGDP